MVMSIISSDSDDAKDPSHPHAPSPSTPAPSRQPRPPPLAPIQQASNPAYMRMIKAIGDLQGDVVRYRAAQILLLIAYVLCVLLWWVYRVSMVSRVVVHLTERSTERDG